MWWYQQPRYTHVHGVAKKSYGGSRWLYTRQKAYQAWKQTRSWPRRTWRRADALLRSISLAIASGYSHDGEEEVKPLVEHSFFTALSRCAIHLLPTLVSVILLIINCTGYFVGTELAGISNQDTIKLGAIQVCAKIQELLIIASVSTFIFHLTRIELTAREGLPLGLLEAGFSYTRLSFFWSPGFISGFDFDRRSRLRRLFFLTTVVVGGFVALFAGPASAILMLPRVQQWRAGGSIFWLNGTYDDYWPNSLPGTSKLQMNFCSDFGRLWDGGCPNSGYLAIYQYFTATQHPPESIDFPVHDSDMFRRLIGWPRSVDDSWVMAPHLTTTALQDKLRASWESHVYDANYAYKTAPHATALDVGGIGRFAYAKQRESSVKVMNPLVRAVCSARKEVYWNLTMSNSSDIEVDFPVLYKNRTWSFDTPVKDTWKNNRGPTGPYNVASLLTEIVTATAFNESVVNTKYVALSPEFGQTSMGLLVAHSPWDSNTPNRWAVTGCSIDANWAPGFTTITDDYNGAPYDQVWHHSVSVAQVTPSQTDVGWQSNYMAVESHSDGQRTHPVTIDQDWYESTFPSMTNEYLPPARVQALVSHSHRNYSTIDWLFSNLDLVTELDIQIPNDEATNFGRAPIYIETMLATLLADAMARINYIYNDVDEMTALPDPVNARQLVRQGAPVIGIVPPDQYQERNLTQLTMTQTITGYAYSTDSTFERFSIAILSLHMTFALGHTLWTLLPWVWWKRRMPGYWSTSSAWDNITDWIALALKSSQPRADILDNVGAGVHKMNTLSRMAYVAVTEPGKGSEAERLELCLQRNGLQGMLATDARRPETFVQVDVKYA